MHERTEVRDTARFCGGVPRPLLPGHDGAQRGQWRGLLALLGVNLAYHRRLRQLSGGQGIDDLSGVAAETLVGTPLSMPVALLMGILLGHACWYCGGLLLPGLLSFARDLVVLMLELRL